MPTFTISILLIQIQLYSFKQRLEVNNESDGSTTKYSNTSKNEIEREHRTESPRAFKEDLLSRDHSEPGADILMDGVAEFGPGAALDGPLAEASVGEFASASDGGDLDLIAVVVEFVFDSLLDAVVIGANHLLRRQEEVQVLAVVLVQLSPSDLRRRLVRLH